MPPPERPPAPSPMSWLPESIQRIVTVLGKLTLYLGAFGTFVVALGKVRQPLEDFLGTKDPKIIVPVAALPLAMALLFDAVPVFLRWRRARRLEARSVNAANARPRFFRTTPFFDTERDHDLFAQGDYARDDGIHSEVLEWITRSDSNVLFLSGRSGVGKTSLVNAFVVPALRGRPPPNSYLTFTVRSFESPLISLSREFTKRGLLPEESSADAGTVVRRIRAVAAQSEPANLLIVFDQFEELLILAEDAAASLEPIERLVEEFDREPTQNVRLLFVVRSDYLAQLLSFRFPPLQQERNWFEVPSFTVAAARKFLLQSGMQVSGALVDDLMRQAIEIEETPGLIRPITVNMLGLALERLSEGDQRLLRHGPRIGGLLTRYVESCLRLPETKDHAKQVLRPMITDAGTKRPCSIEEIASHSELSRGVISGCLSYLAGAGIVRRLETTKDLWEISHDFVARLIHYVIGNWRRTAIERVRPWLAPLSLLLWAVVFLAVWPQLQNWQTKRTVDQVYATFKELDLAASRSDQIKHVYVPPASYEQVKALVHQATLTSDPTQKARYELQERAFAVRLLSFFESTFLLWEHAKTSRNSSEREFLEKTMAYFTGTLLRNPRLLYYWHDNGGRLHTILDPATNRYYEQAVLNDPRAPLALPPDPIGPFH